LSKDKKNIEKAPERSIFAHFSQTTEVDGVVNRFQDCDTRVIRAMRRMIHAVDTYSRELRATCNITGPQLACLTAVVQDGPMCQSTLSQQVHLSPSTVVGIIDRLEAKGLLCRQRAERDRRQSMVNATESGRNLAASAPSLLKADFILALRALTSEEQVRIAESMERVVELLEAPAAPAGSPPPSTASTRRRAI